MDGDVGVWDLCFVYIMSVMLCLFVMSVVRPQRYGEMTRELRGYIRRNDLNAWTVFGYSLHQTGMASPRRPPYTVRFGGLNGSAAMLDSARQATSRSIPESGIGKAEKQSCAGGQRRWSKAKVRGKLMVAHVSQFVHLPSRL